MTAVQDRPLNKEAKSINSNRQFQEKLRREAEAVLQDLAFVLKMSARVKESLLAGK